MAIAGSARKSTGNPLWLDNFRWKFVPVDAPVGSAERRKGNDEKLVGILELAAARCAADIAGSIGPG